MKSGASDPFADDDTSAESEPEQASAAGATETQGSASEAEPVESQSGSGDSNGPDTLASNTDESNDSDTLASDTSRFNRSDLPFVLRRDKVKDERDDVHQLFVQADTDDQEEDARRELDDRFEESVYKLDAREAIYLAGMQNLDDAEAVLREWGYDL